MATAIVERRVSENSWRRFIEFRIARLERQQSELSADEYTREVQKKIKKMVADHFGMGMGMLDANSNRHAIVFPRQIAMYLMYANEGMSYPEVGRAFGGKHHTTVMHSVQKVNDQRMVDKRLDALLRKFAAELSGQVSGDEYQG